MDVLVVVAVLLALATAVYGFVRSYQLRRDASATVAAINEANARLETFLRTTQPDGDGLMDLGQWYVIDLNYQDLYEEVPEEGPYDMWATGPFDSYEEAQDFGNRTLQWFAVVTLT